MTDQNTQQNTIRLGGNEVTFNLGQTYIVPRIDHG
jgi:hypothetical protein